MTVFYRIARRFLRIVMPLIWNIRIENRQGLDHDGAYVISCNHIFWSDPLMVAYKGGRMIHFLGKKELFEKCFPRTLFNALGAVPIDRDNSDLKGVKTVLKLLKSGEVLGIFPEGTRTGGEFYKEMQEGAAFFALRAGCPIVPCGIAGSNRFRGKIQLCVGEPIKLEKYAGKKPDSEDMQEVTHALSEEIIKLSERAKSLL